MSQYVKLMQVSRRFRRSLQSASYYLSVTYKFITRNIVPFVANDARTMAFMVAVTAVMISSTCLVAEETPTPQQTTPDGATATQVANFLSRPQRPAPTPPLGVTWSPAQLDFGHIRWTDQPSQKLTLTNTSANRVRVQITPACGCTTVNQSIVWVDAGQTTTVEVALRVQDVDGPLAKTLGVTVVDEAGRRAKASVPVSAVVANPLQVIPRVVNFGTVQVDHVPDPQTVIITSLEGTLDLTGVRGETPFQAKFTVLNPHLRYSVTISPITPLHVGPLFGEVILASATPGRPDVRILVSMRVVADQPANPTAKPAQSVQDPSPATTSPPSVPSLPLPTP